MGDQLHGDDETDRDGISHPDPSGTQSDPLDHDHRSRALG